MNASTHSVPEAIRDDARSILGPRFDWADLPEAILLEGSLPVRPLQASLQEWARAQQHETA